MSVAIEAGAYAIGPGTGPLTLHTRRSGPVARVGHDLVIEVASWHGTVVLDDERVEASTVEVVIDATSFEVREGTGGAVPLLAINKAEILRTMARVLRTAKYPEIRFVSRSVSPDTNGYVVHGDVTLTGKTRPVDLTVALDDGEGPGGTVSATLLHSDFGIKPYSAMFGALRVRDAVDLRADVRLS